MPLGKEGGSMAVLLRKRSLMICIISLARFLGENLLFPRVSMMQVMASSRPSFWHFLRDTRL
jgi:hypothetical protein